jgi:hypothetical protein
MFKDGDKVALSTCPTVLIGTLSCDGGNTAVVKRLDGKSHCIFVDDGTSHRDPTRAPYPPVVLVEEGLFFVFNPQGGAPRVPHSTHASAQSEAERLAKLNPAHKFYVLKAVDEFSATVTVVHEAL